MPQWLQRPGGPDRNREIPALVFIGPRGSGKTALLDRLAAACELVPHARFDFDRGGAARPRQVVTSLSFQLAKRRGQFGRLQFPRLMLGLLAIDSDIDLQDRTRALADVRKLLDDDRRLVTLRKIVDGLAEELRASGRLPPGSGLAADLALDGLTSLFLRRLLRGQALSWYGGLPGGHRDDPAEALIDLNWMDRGPDGDVRPADRVDEILCDAFLADLRAAYTRDRRASSRTYNCVGLLDNIDARSGSLFVDLLVRARHRHAGADGQDPLVVVATSRRLEPGERPRVRGQDEAGYDDWRRHRPAPATLESRRYVVRLRNLDRDDETMNLVETAGLDSVPHLARLAHRLTHGHPWTIRLLLDAVGQSLRSGAPATMDLRGVLDLPAPRPPRHSGARTATVVDHALGYLLQGIDEGLKGHLIAGAAARDVGHMVSPDTLGPARPNVPEHLHAFLATHLWMVTGRDGRAPVAVVDPLLRRLLLHKLAARGGSHPDGWDAVHTRLRDGYRRQGSELDALYHDLALGNLEAAVDYLDQSLEERDPGRWLGTLEALTSAPYRLSRERSPREQVAHLAAAMRDGGARRAALCWLVAAMWIFHDPLGDPAFTLPDVIADQFSTLARLAGPEFHVLFDEAAESRKLGTLP